jgi:hypothetical protein
MPAFDLRQELGELEDSEDQAPTRGIRRTPGSFDAFSVHEPELNHTVVIILAISSAMSRTSCAKAVQQIS